MAVSTRTSNLRKIMQDTSLAVSPVVAPPVEVAAATGVVPQRTLTERLTENKALITALAPQVQAHHLMVVEGHSYVKVAGGIALAEALGYAISVGSVSLDKESDEFPIYISTATLTDRTTGTVIATAEGYLGLDERRWKSAALYARRSMCQTRAVAKLCRVNFGAMYVMLGATSDTPAEEIPERNSEQPAYSAPRQALPAARPTPPAPRPTQQRNDNGFNPMDADSVTPTLVKVLKTGESDRGKWILYGVDFREGFSATTFSQTIADKIATVARDGDRVHGSFKQGRNGGWELVDFRVIANVADTNYSEEIPF
jgi:hypothetical protein